MNKNPFTENFGQIPQEIISRDNSLRPVYEDLDSKNSVSNIYIITGPRGWGKTVSLTSIFDKYAKENNWLVVNINPLKDIYIQLASQLYEKGKLKKLFVKKEFNFGFKHFSFSIYGEEPVSSIDSLIDKMFIYLKKKQVRVLIALDEAINNKYMREFAHSFQYYLRSNYDVYLIMTGLYSNITPLINHKQLTFLLRAPKISLEPLSNIGMVNKYKEIFNISQDEAIALAKFTKGYGFAFQVLGTLLFKHQKTMIDNKILDEFDIKLYDCVYNKIWEDLSKAEKEILIAIANFENPTSSEIAKVTKIPSNTFQVLKTRLKQQGIVANENRNELSFSLPRFKEFVNFIKKM